MNRRYRQRGFGVVAAVLILVLLASLAAAVMRSSAGQQSASAQDIAAAYANQAARAGVEWGLYQAMTSSTCAPAPTTLNFTAINGFTVVVNCTASNFNEGVNDTGAPIVKTIYVIDAIACNTANCPNAGTAVAGSNYVERRRMATACATQAAPPNPGGPC